MKKRGRIKIHKIKTWQLIVILIPLFFIDATLLRFDHIRMTELRDAVLAADEAEDDVAVSENLEKLKDYVFNNIVINAAAAKSLQWCPTLCDPMDRSPPGSRVPGILQARTLEWVAISFSNA